MIEEQEGKSFSSANVTLVRSAFAGAYQKTICDCDRIVVVKYIF